jgi:hypothetical protein
VHHGRVVKRTGDGAIVEFRSVVDAVRCAIEVQNGLIERNAGLPPEKRIEFRVGRADPNALAELSHLFDLEGSVTELRNRLSHLGGYGCEKALAGAECEEVLATIQEAIAISRRLDQTRYASIDVLLDACLSGLGPSLSTYVRAASKSQ